MRRLLIALALVVSLMTVAVPVALAVEGQDNACDTVLSLIDPGAPAYDAIVNNGVCKNK